VIVSNQGKAASERPYGSPDGTTGVKESARGLSLTHWLCLMPLVLALLGWAWIGGRAPARAIISPVAIALILVLMLLLLQGHR
jgi:hypothetical protein